MIPNAEEQGQRAKIVPAYIRFPLILGALAFEIYCLFTESFHVAWIAGFQADLMDGKHFIMLTYLFSFLLVIIPVVIIVRLLIPVYERKKELEEKDIIDS